jgi:hypothetical protein
MWLSRFQSPQSEIAMPTSLSLCASVPRGLAFDIADHILIRDWAKLHDFLALIRLEHGVEGEEYEEVVEFHAGISPLCALIMWRNADAVFVQPPVGRGQRYGSVRGALGGLLLTKCARTSSWFA